MTEPKAMREIHEIREQIYEEIKNMTPAEKTAWFNEGLTKNRNEFKVIDTLPEPKYSDN